MRGELLMVLGIGLTFNLCSIGLYSSKIGEQSIVKAICIDLPSYPILQLLRDLNVLGYFLCSIVFPLCKKRIYHMLLPTGRHHDIVKTMRDFLMEPQFLGIFEAFLSLRDEEEGTGKYSTSLDYWKKLMLVKYKFSNKLLVLQSKESCVRDIR